MVFKVVLGTVAKADVEDYFDFIVEREGVQEPATRWYREVIACIGDLSEFPESHPFAPRQKRLAERCVSALSTHTGSSSRFSLSHESFRSLGFITAADARCDLQMSLATRYPHPTQMPESLTPLLTTEQLSVRVIELANQIRADYDGQTVLLLGVLKGSFHFLSDLSRLLHDMSTVDFVQVSSYGTGKSSTGVVQIRKDLDTNIEGLDVLIVEDIVDTGTTLTHLRELLGTRKPKSLRVVALLSKPEARKHNTQVEYVGFEIPNEFVVGYGLDYGERFRNLPYIAILHEG
jgi:hypoxanthine phosphoribosyltransferase